MIGTNRAHMPPHHANRSAAGQDAETRGDRNFLNFGGARAFDSVAPAR